MSAEYRRIHRGGGDRPVRSVCRWVKVSESGCCARRNRPESSTARRREDLTAIIVKFFDESEQTCGYRRIHAELARSGVKVSLGMVCKIMAAAGLVACQPPETSQDDRAGARLSRPARPVAPRRHRHRARNETGGRHHVYSNLAGIRLPGGRHGLFLEKDRRARDRRSHARRTRHRGLGHGRAGPVHRSVVSRSFTRIEGLDARRPDARNS